MQAKEWCVKLELVIPVKMYGKVIPCFDVIVWTVNVISMLFSQQENVGY